MVNGQVVQGLRTGGRSARIRESVLSAAFIELAESGYADLSVEAVASRAGVNKTTIYRRWQTLEDLLVDALTVGALEIPIPDTGSVEGDLLAVGHELAKLLNDGVGRQIATFVFTAGLRSSELREATRGYFEDQAVRAIPIIVRAIDRGELPTDCDASALLTTFRAPLFYQLVTTGDPIDVELIAQATRVALTAARAGLLAK
ncbi:TetR/AcrR family transcriptional regulator [Arthrobacter cryoconiti]